VQNEAGAGNHWTGVVVQTNDDPAGQLGSDDLVLVWLASGKDETSVVAGEGIENTEGGAAPASVNPLSDTMAPGIWFDTASGNMGAGTPIRMIGVDSDWNVTPGTMAELDGHSLAVGGITIDNKGDATLEHFEIHDVNETGVALTDTANVYKWHFMDCDIYNNSVGIGRAVGSDKVFYFSLILGCHLHANTNAVGQTTGWQYSAIMLSTASGNTTAGGRGFRTENGCFLWGCLAYGNNDAGISGAAGVQVVQCVSDGNGYGVKMFTNGTVLGCRLTNNTTAGLNADNVFAHDLWNYYGDQNGAATSGSLIDPNWQGTSTRTTTGAEGYEDIVVMFNFDNGSGDAYIEGELLTGANAGTARITAITDNGATGTVSARWLSGARFVDGEQITGGTGGKTADLDGDHSLTNPKYTLALGAAGYRQMMTMPDGLSVARFAAGLPTMPLVRPKG